MYGCGKGCISFFSTVIKKFKEIKIEAIIDKKAKKGYTFRNIPLFSPKDFYLKNPEQYIVIITVGKERYYDEIFSYLKSIGVQYFVTINDIYEFHFRFGSEKILNQGVKYYIKNKEKILKAIDLLEDDQSREIYFKFIKIHLLKKPIRMSQEPEESQYFPSNIKLRYDRFINCGAYKGDTIEALNRKLGKIQALACFEADPFNFKELYKFLKEKRNALADLVLAFPVAVYSSNKMLKFSVGNDISSRIDNEGNFMIQGISIDETLISFHPTLIQMDIEGAELEALKGARFTIENDRPDLAISIYHSPDHIWEIPLYLHKLNKNYKFYLRNYSGYTDDIILYAVSD